MSQNVPTDPVVEIRLPYGSTRLEVRENFAHLGGYSSVKIYDNDYDREHPSSDVIRNALNQLPENHVMIVLCSNTYTLENELHAFVVTTVEGWEELIGPTGGMYPKVVRVVPFSAVSYLAC